MSKCKTEVLNFEKHCFPWQWTHEIAFLFRDDRFILDICMKDLCILLDNKNDWSQHCYRIVKIRE